MTRLSQRAVKDWIKSRLRDAALTRAVRRLQRMTDAQVANVDNLREFREAFGNQGFSGDCRFLAESARRASRASVAILECGSGASTIVVGLLAARRGVRVMSLEQDAEWYKMIRRDLDRLGISNVDLYHAPLRNFGEYDWYDIDRVTLPPRFDSALCDGPAFCRGWRRGLLPVLAERRTQIDEILCDDADDPNAAAMFDFWKQYGAGFETMTAAEGAIAVVHPKTLADYSDRERQTARKLRTRSR